MTKPTRFLVSSVLDKHIRGQGGIGATTVAEWVGVAVRTVDRWCSNETRLTAVELLDLVAAVQQEEPVRAAALWRDLSALVRQESRPAPRAVVAPSIEDGCLTVVVEAGHVSEALRRARHPQSPGGVDIVPSEAAEIASECRDVEIAAMGTGAAARSVPSPQLMMEVA